MVYIERKMKKKYVRTYEYNQYSMVYVYTNSKYRQIDIQYTYKCMYNYMHYTIPCDDDDEAKEGNKYV